MSRQLTTEQRDKIISIMRQNGAVVGYLFGSYARGTAGPLSDIDVGVIFPEDTDKKSGEDRVEKIRAGLEEMFGRDKADVVNVPTAKNPLLRYMITFGDGNLLFSLDDTLKNTAAYYSRRDFEDTKHLRRIQADVLKHIFD
ncbi:MAG: nucleotidyltransferase domain-containing protein [Patescibacteria group bacterium]|nr:nucleotidyltransferase domain-containing protein [Patescibacteria group bacterium]MDE2172324.1 nucleotidyltransferase domain-containing protein [Patescibacteria group bacterium]